MNTSGRTLKESICDMTLNTGFSRVRILAPFILPENLSGSLKERYGGGSPSLLVAALPYGNGQNVAPKNATETYERIEKKYRAYIAPFAQRNYYKEAVKRLQKLSQTFRRLSDGTKFGCRSSYRIFCNSPVPEKPLALACGLGEAGHNSLVITPEAGSFVIIAAMTLPFPLESDPSESCPCGTCGFCVESCPTQAIRQEGGIDRNKCIQWYAAGNADSVPQPVVEKWGQRLYGCTVCQDVCPHNKKPIRGTETREGMLPAYEDARKILTMTDEEIRSFFKGTVMGLSWLKPEHIRRSAGLVLKNF
jgi:epoxyqueuosine reductase